MYFVSLDPTSLQLTADQAAYVATRHAGPVLLERDGSLVPAETVAKRSRSRCGQFAGTPMVALRSHPGCFATGVFIDGRSHVLIGYASETRRESRLVALPEHRLGLDAKSLDALVAQRVSLGSDWAVSSDGDFVYTISGTHISRVYIADLVLKVKD